MLKIKTVSKNKAIKRRDFLSRTAVAGSMAFLSTTSFASVHAIGASTNNLLNSANKRKTVRLKNVTVDDFTDLVGQKFHLQAEDGAGIHARLIEANSPKTRRGLRFRREHFSIVFDVPVGPELTQAQYRLTHPQIGSIDLFMVPVDLPSKHCRLEAVFT